MSTPLVPDAAHVRANQIVKNFSQGATYVHALREVSLEINRGDFVAVMGASGSGKSTLLHVLAGLTLPDRGRVEIEGHDLGAMDDHQRTLFRRRHLGMVFQAYNLVPSLTVTDNIALPLLLAGTRADTERLDHMLALLGLSERRTHLPDRLSGGEQQRVALARALITNPALLLADEPTGNLDSANRRHICDLLQKLNQEQGCSILMVTHDVQVAAAAGRVVLLADGAIQADWPRRDFVDLAGLTRLSQELLASAEKSA